MVAGNGRGKVYVTDIKHGAVFVFDFNNKSVTLLGGEGAAGLFGQPTGIAVDNEGNIYVADSAKRKIMIFTGEGKPHSAVDLSDKLKSIGFIAYDNQRKRLVVPDPKEHKIHVVDLKGTILFTMEVLDKIEGGFHTPNAVAVAPNGDIVVADSMNARIVLFNSEGKYLSTFGNRGDNPGQLNINQGVAVDSAGHIYVTDARDNRFTIFNTKGQVLLVVGKAGDSRANIGVFQIPFGISIDQNDTIYIVEKYFGRFQKYQYISAEYLAKNPIKPENLAKPIDPENKLKNPLQQTK